jgi:hypothetical protein
MVDKVAVQQFYPDSNHSINILYSSSTDTELCNRSSPLVHNENSALIWDHTSELALGNYFFGTTLQVSCHIFEILQHASTAKLTTEVVLFINTRLNTRIHSNKVT